MRCLCLAVASVACLVGLASCGDKSAVSLSATLQQANVSVDSGAFATLAGGFQLRLDLGPEASGSTSVTLGNFSLQGVSGSALVDPLPVEASAVSFPLTVDRGSSQTVSFVISSKASLTQDQHDAICSGQVVIVGSVMDSLKGGTDSVRSVAITPSC